MRYRKLLAGAILGVVAVTLSVFLFLSCGGGGGGGIPVAASGKVALYVTDDMSSYKQVIATIDTIRIVNTGTGAACDVLTTPVTVDIANLANVMQLINVSGCPALSYNRIRIEFEKSVQLMDMAATASTCSFTSYKDEGKKPNALRCDPVSGICVLDITGAVNVLVNQTEKLALDFNLKDFDVENFGDPGTCSVTMKVSPLHGEEMEHLGHPERISGSISNLDTAAKTFTLRRGNLSFTVDYSGITDAQQPGIDMLLQQAQTDGLRVKVTSPGLDLSGGTIVASAVFVDAEGKISNLTEAAHTFTLTYKAAKTMTVSYAPPAIIEGALADGLWVEVKLYGYDAVSTNFLAGKIEVESEGTSTDD